MSDSQVCHMDKRNYGLTDKGKQTNYLTVTKRLSQTTVPNRRIASIAMQIQLKGLS